MKKFVLYFSALFLVLMMATSVFAQDDEGYYEDTQDDSEEVADSTAPSSVWEFQINLGIGLRFVDNPDLKAWADWYDGEMDAFNDAYGMDLAPEYGLSDGSSATPFSIDARFFYSYFGVGVRYAYVVASAGSKYVSEEYKNTTEFRAEVSANQTSLNLMVNFLPRSQKHGVILGVGVSSYTDVTYINSHEEDHDGQVGFGEWDFKYKSEDALGYQVFAEYQYKYSMFVFSFGIDYSYVDTFTDFEDSDGVLADTSDGSEPLEASLNGATIYFGVGLSFGNVPKSKECCF